MFWQGNKFINNQLDGIPNEEKAIEKSLDRIRMREYSANIADALNYKIRLFAMERAKTEKERSKRFNDQQRRMLAHQ